MPWKQLLCGNREITLPAETSIRLGLEVRQELILVELADGIKLVNRNLKLERQM